MNFISRDVSVVDISGSDPTQYREMARLTRGAYFRFDAASVKALRELLSAVAVYAAGGRGALEDRSQSGESGAKLLLEQLK